MADENKPGESSGAGDQTDYKAEFEKIKSEHETLKKSNEEMRLEFMGDEYLNFLETKSKPAIKEEVKTTSSNDDLDKLTPRQAYERARKEAEDLANSKISEFKESLQNESKQKTAADVTKFFKNDPDAERYRPIMAGLANRHLDADLNELLKLAKQEVKNLSGIATEEEKAKSRRSQGEKPGASTSSFQPGGKRMSDQEALDKAWDETVGKDGVLPAAI